VANVTRVRVEAPNGPVDERAFRRLLKEFRHRVEKAGIPADVRMHAVYEKPSAKRARKRRERARVLRSISE